MKDIQQKIKDSFPNNKIEFITKNNRSRIFIDEKEVVPMWLLEIEDYKDKSIDIEVVLFNEICRHIKEFIEENK